RRRHTRFSRDWSSDVCSSDLLGIDYTSPEAAVAGESFRALRNAVRHLVSASGSGRELIARGAGDTVAMASELNADAVAPVLRDEIGRASCRERAAIPDEQGAT